MRVLRSKADVDGIADAALRQLIEERITQIEENCPWDTDVLGPIIVVEPGDSADVLEAEIGFPVLRGLYDGVPFGEVGYAPAFEFVEAIGDAFFEMVFIIGGDFGYDILLINQPGIDPVLKALCLAYATPANT